MPFNELSELLLFAAMTDYATKMLRGLHNGFTSGPLSHRSFFLRAVLDFISVLAARLDSTGYQHEPVGLERQFTQILERVFLEVSLREPDGNGSLTQEILLWLGKKKGCIEASRKLLFGKCPYPPLTKALLAVSSKALDGGQCCESAFKAALAFMVVAVNGGHINDDDKGPGPDNPLITAIETTSGRPLSDVFALLVRHHPLMPAWVRKTLGNAIDQVTERMKTFPKALVSMVGQELCYLCCVDPDILYRLAKQPKLRQLIAHELVQHPKRPGFTTNIFDVIERVANEEYMTASGEDAVLFNSLYEPSRWHGLWKNMAADYNPDPSYYLSHDTVLVELLTTIYDQQYESHVPRTAEMVGEDGWSLSEDARHMAMEADLSLALTWNHSHDDLSGGDVGGDGRDVNLHTGLVQWIMTGIAGSPSR